LYQLPALPPLLLIASSISFKLATVTLQDRKSNYLTKYIKQLGEAMRHVKRIHPFKIIAMVVLPDHLHAMWDLPENDANFSLRWRCIKISFAAQIKKCGITVKKNQYNENLLWQRRFWEHAIRNEKDYEQHVNYIHYNPVKHNLVKRVSDWPYSTFHQYVKEGILPANWSAAQDDLYVE